jgi:hypothetical protein
VVDGRAEEIYWEKIPDKIKMAAISRLPSISRQLMEGASTGDGDIPQITGVPADETGSQRENKRRKKA